MWIVWARLAYDKVAAANSGERVHIRLHMPEVVRQHTHFQKVYKQLPIAVAAPIHHPIHSQAPHSQLMPVGKPHVSLLGYTTTASGSGGMSPSLMQLMSTAATPMPMPMPMPMGPNYGPALFDSYNQPMETGLRETMSTVKTGGSATSSSYLGTAPGSSSYKQQQLLQQLFTPNLMAAITAAQKQREELVEEEQLDNETEPQPETELEHNELLNGNFLAALQREYFSKFGRKRKKVKFASNTRTIKKRPQKQLKYVQQTEQQFDEYQDEPDTEYEPTDEVEDEPYEERSNFWGDQPDRQNDARGYDSAVAFSGQNNALSVDEFIKNEVHGNSYAPFYGNNGNTMYDDDYDGTGTSSSWQGSPTINSYPRPTKATSTRLRTRQRRPGTSMGTGSGSGTGSGFGSTTKPGKLRYIKLTTRKKRKNHIRAKRYRA
ncbi:uncharacterized protein LOC6568155 [Drosophila grimshawi]|uniref:GH17331 n=1 Tax=Drosophila grimshawi TaxID=7222 RepID=B4JUQ8_DROGR|nr:uncharacterized protein LOC6568155 [Drosophila grimshawi]EDV91228.1 GH17331 [Drosophila grimshawi]